MIRRHLKNLLIGVSFIFFVAAPVNTVALPSVASAACERSILGMPTWFRGMTDANCNIVGPGSPDPADPSKEIELPGFIWKIALNVIEIGLFIAGYVALFFLLYGGFQFLTGGANPSQVEKARMTMLNAVIGLAISIAAIAIVNLIFRVING
jgi:hypothetical protein